MSYILEALNKSQRARREGADGAAEPLPLPDLGGARATPPRRRGTSGVVVLAVIVALAVGVFAWLEARAPRSASTVPARAPTTAMTPSVASDAASGVDTPTVSPAPAPVPPAPAPPAGGAAVAAGSAPPQPAVIPPSPPARRHEAVSAPPAGEAGPATSDAGPSPVPMPPLATLPPPRGTIATPTPPRAVAPPPATSPPARAVEPVANDDGLPALTDVRPETRQLLRALTALAATDPSAGLQAEAPAPRITPPAAPLPVPSPSPAPLALRPARTGVPAALGDMVVNAHLYASEAGERMVIINMRRYREGERTREGAVVERITPSGAEMRFEGEPFLLPRR